eukprot:6172555-Pleurochrysis_carterae.AAC.1
MVRKVGQRERCSRTKSSSFGRGGLLRPDSRKRQPLVRQAQDVVRRCVEPMARLPLSKRRGRPGQRRAGARRRPHQRRR